MLFKSRQAAFCLLTAALSLCLGLATEAAGPKSLAMYPALRHTPVELWAALFIVPGAAAIALIPTRLRRLAVAPFLLLAGVYAFWDAMLSPVAVAHGNAVGIVLWTILCAYAVLAAIEAGEL